MARQRGNRFQADVMLDGKRKRVSFATLKEAQEFELASKRGHAATGALAFKRFHEEHFEYLWGDSKAPEATAYCLAKLDEFIPAWTPITEIDSAYVFRLTVALKKSGVSNGTINRRLSTLSKLLRHGERLGVMSRPLFDYLREPHGRERTLSDREEKRMLTYFRHHGLDQAWAVSCFLLYTGCRLGEVFSLLRDRVSGGKVMFHYTITKTSKTRLVPLVGPAKDAWDYMCQQSDDDRPFSIYSRNTFRGHWTRMKDHLRFSDDEEFVPHMLRHTCASRLVARGVPLPKVMLWMGHTSIQTTLRYSHLVPRDLDDVGRVLWPSVEKQTQE